MDTVSLTIHVIIGMLRQLAVSMDDLIDERIEEYEQQQLNMNEPSSPGADEDDGNSDNVRVAKVEEIEEYEAFVENVKTEIKEILRRNIENLEVQLPPEQRFLDNKADAVDADEGEENDKENVFPFWNVSSKDVCMVTVVSFLDLVEDEIDQVFRKHLETIHPEALPGGRRPSR